MSSQALKSAGFTPSQVQQFCFKALDNGKFKCKFGCKREYSASAGPTNLCNHVVNCHNEWKELMIEATTTCGPIDDHFKSSISVKALKMHSWVRFVVFGDMPLSIVENKEIRKISKIESTTTKTLIKYLEALQCKVERTIKSKLQAAGNIGLIFDNWTCRCEHYTGIFATYVETIHNVKYVREILLCCGVQDEIEGEDDIDFSAASMGDYIIDELQLVGISLTENVDFICGDNCPTNQKLADIISAKIVKEKGRSMHTKYHLLVVLPIAST
jgi:hypothetical protein